MAAGEIKIKRLANILAVSGDGRNHKERLHTIVGERKSEVGGCRVITVHFNFNFIILINWRL